MGNIRLSYFRNGNNSAEVLEENNFYPFGLKHEGYNAQAGNPSYTYQYNGKELQKETGWSDYGARMYMSDIGRWGVIDPLAEQMRRYSPYTYAYNNPIRFIDPDGRKAQAPDEPEFSAPQGSLWWFYAGSGKKDMRSLMAYVGSPDNIGTFFALSDMASFGGVYGGGGGGGGGPTPKNSTGPGLIGIISHFITGLFTKKEEGAGIKTYLPGATVTRASLQVGTAEGAFETALKWEEILAALGTITKAGKWGIPLMLNGDSSHARGYDIPLTGATDIPAEESDPNLYLYRIMKNEGGFPKVGDGLDKLGLRDRDVNKLTNSTRISNSFENGLSVSIGYGSDIPPNVPDFTGGKGTLFRVQASSLIFYGLIGVPLPKPDNPYYGQIRPAVPMNVGTFRALIRSSSPAWQPVK